MQGYSKNIFRDDYIKEKTQCKSTAFIGYLHEFTEL